MKPIIGIFSFPLLRDNKPFSALGETYSDAVLAGGGLPLLFPCVCPKEDLEKLLELCDGLLFLAEQTSIPPFIMRILLRK